MPFLQNRLNCTEKSALATDSLSVAKNQTSNQEAEPLKYLWIRAPKAMVYNSNFSDGAKLLYLILLDYQGRNAQAFPSLETLARDTGKSVRRVQQLLKELEAGEAIEIVSQPGWVNLYKVGLPPVTSTEITKTSDKANLESVLISNPELNEQIVDSAPIFATAFSNSNNEAQFITPLKDVATPPLKNIAAELDSAKLESKNVCKKSLVADSRTQVTSGPNNTNVMQVSTFGQKPQSKFSAQLSQKTLTDEQNKIATTLQLAGVAKIDAVRIAATNPKLENVQQWIEFAKSKANPGGYLAVVLSKSDVAPPQKHTSASAFSRRGDKKNWRDNKRSNQESGAVAYMRRHQSELAKQQTEQPLESLEASTASNFEVATENAEMATATPFLNSFEPITQSEVEGSNQIQAVGRVNWLDSSQAQNDNGFKLNWCSFGLVAELKNSGTSGQVLQIENPQLENSEEASFVDEIASPDLAFERQVKAIIRQVDREACQYLRQIRFEGDNLLVSFVGNYQPRQNVASWLPLLKTHFATIREVLLL